MVGRGNLPIPSRHILINNFLLALIFIFLCQAIVLSRNCGAVSVCEISNLQNLLGESPEFLAGSAQVKRFHSEKGFLALECEVDVLCKSRNSEEILEVLILFLQL